MTITLTMRCPVCEATDYLDLQGCDEPGRADLYCMRCGNITRDFITPEMDDGSRGVGLRFVGSFTNGNVSKLKLIE